MSESERYWYKEAVIYSLDVRSFKDGNGDGAGDFKGLLEKLDYLIELGITCLWILPFYCSENKDSGYDVIDYYSVDPETGSLEDFKQLMQKANHHNIKVLIELVVNHTSSEHRWFKEAVKNADSKYRKYYIWLDEKPANDKEDVVFKDVEDSNWEYHKEAKAYYYHTFYSHQPDLNVANPDVQEEILKIIDFWMNLGVSGFRIDSVPHIMRDKGEEKFKGDPYQVLDKWQLQLSQHNSDAILIAEADVEPKEYKNFLGHGERIHGMLNFHINNYIFLALANKDPLPLIKALEHLPVLQTNEQYLNFLRNHDELDLERLEPYERQQVFDAFGPEEHMRIYGRGIRRRLPPMVNNNRDVIELAFSLLFSLPGTPVLRYGEEIGMGDDLSLRERDSVRTAMQWSAEKNGGFSTVSSGKLFWPIISGGPYGYEKVNVAAQKADSSSLLNCVKVMVYTRRQFMEFAYGTFENLETGHPQVMGHLCRYKNGIAFALHNFSEKSCKSTIRLKNSEKLKFRQLLGEGNYNITDKQVLEIELPPYGYSWWRS